ncbi:MAG: Gfo/Idh/MocA family oxidoreductase [Acidimicrobiia bacterium]|nr:Gfo/Idh/MocA family oxidoreductase [Acidimicrobiia bacterium]NNC41119.1 Gfo/Idh/MocA family oxidoreductase [Acidimicrobiia bacterium]
MTVVVGQIGVGYWGPNLLRNLSTSARTELRQVAESSEERRQFVQARYPGLDVATSATEVFDNPEIDAVVIATPAESHFDLAMQALVAGKHILVEKPMAVTAAAVRQIGERAKDRNRVAMVGHTFLYNDAVLFLKDLVDSGELGDIRYVFAQRLNLGRIRSDVDALWNFGPHDVSIIEFLLDNERPATVSRTGSAFVQEGIEDVVFVHLNFPSGAMAHVHLSWLDPHKVRRMTVVGSEKMVVYDDIADYKIAIYDKGIDPIAVLGTDMDYDAPNPQFALRSGDAVFPSFPMREPLSNEIAHWVDAIEDGVPCRTGPDHAELVVDILERAAQQDSE